MHCIICFDQALQASFENFESYQNSAAPDILVENGIKIENIGR